MVCSSGKEAVSPPVGVAIDASTVNTENGKGKKEGGETLPCRLPADVKRFDTD